MKKAIILLLLALPAQGQILDGILGSSQATGAVVGTLALRQRLYDRAAFANKWICTNATPNVCTLTIAASTAGDSATIQTYNSDSTNTTIASVTGGCTWAIKTTAHVNDSTNGNLNGASCDSMSAGATSIVVTMSGASSFNAVAFHEFSSTTTSQFDVAGAVANAASSSSQNGPDLTLTGTNDAIVQFAVGNAQAVTAFSAPYSTNYLAQNSAAQSIANGAGSYVINTASGTHTTATMGASVADTHVLLSAIAIKAN